MLEVGYGSGTSLPWYDASKVERLIALDPASGAFPLAAAREAIAGFPAEHITLGGEDIPLDAASVDTVVVAYTLCTIPDVIGALEQMRRVLKPHGELLFAEHGLAPSAGRQRLQRCVAPLWARAFGGCQLTREPLRLLERAGFSLQSAEALDVTPLPPLPGISLVRHNYVGVARPV